MNNEKFEIVCYRQRLLDHEAAIRLEKNCNEKCKELEKKHKDNKIKIKYSELSDETLRAIQTEFLISLSKFNIEGFTLSTEVKRIDRIFKYRKKPLLDN